MSSMINLSKQLQLKYSCFKLLLIKFSELEAVHEKLLSEPTKVIIVDLLAVVKRLWESRNDVTKVFNVVVICIK